MTQPRKQQIKNLKTAHTLVDKVGAGDGFDGTEYSVVDSGGDTRYTDLLAKSLTGTIGGSEADVPPTLWGGEGPYVVSAGQQFTVILPGVNLGNPITCTVQAGDLVLIGGLSRLTPARLAKIINTAVSGYGVATAVATYEHGRIVLRGANGSGRTFGSSYFVTLADLTPGIVAAFGFGASPATSTGVSGPKRGVVTYSADGVTGGMVPLRRADGREASPPADILHLGGNKLLPRWPVGDSVFGRLTYEPTASGPEAVLRFARKGVAAPSFTTDGADFASMTGGESLQFTVVDPLANWAGFGSVTFNVSMAGVSSLATFVSAVNSAWSAAAIDGAGTEAVRSVVLSAQEPFSFVGTFTFDYNGTPVISSLNGEVNATDAAAVVTAAIASAGLVAELEATTVTLPSEYGRRIVVRTKTAGSNHPITVIADNTLGFPVAKHVGHSLCAADGACEARFSLPQTGSASAAIVVVSTAPTMAKLGFTGTTAGAAAADGEQSVEAQLCQAFLPEVMEFGEVPDDQDSLIHSFLRRAEEHADTETTGALKAIRSMLTDKDGKLLQALMPAVAQLVAGQVVLGAGKVSDNASSTNEPRIVVPNRGWTLVAESESMNIGGTGHVRIYTSHLGLMVTWNAYLTDGSANITKDASAQVSYMMGLLNSGAGVYIDLTAGATFTSWGTLTTFNDSSDYGVVEIGRAFASATSAEIRPMISTPPGDARMTLIWSNADLNDPTESAVRIYSKWGVGIPAEFWITTNALRDGAGNWLRDDDADAAAAIYITVDQVKFLGQPAGAGTFASWTTSSELTNGKNLNLTGSLTLGAGLADTVAGRITPHVKSKIHPSVTDDKTKTLLFKSEYISASAYPNTVVRLYLDEKPAGTLVDTLAITVVLNAVWDGTVWTQELVSSPSTMVTFDLSGLRIYRMAAGAGPTWADASWLSRMRLGTAGIQYLDAGLKSQLDGDGLTLLNTSATPAANKLTANNIVKAWGRVHVHNNGGGGVTVAAADANANYGTNTAVDTDGYSVSGGGDIVVNFSSTYLTGYVLMVQAYASYNYGPPSPLRMYQVNGVTKAATSATVSFDRLHYSAGGGAVTGADFDLTALPADEGIVMEWTLMAKE